HFHASNAVILLNGDTRSFQAFTHRLEFLLRVKGIISMSAVDELLGVLLVYLLALRLAIRSMRPTFADAFIDFYSHPFERSQYIIIRSGHKPVLVGVLNPQYHCPLMLSRQEVVVQCGSHTTNMQCTGRTGRKSTADFFHEIQNVL